MTDYADEILGTDYFYPGAAAIRTHSGRESERSDRVECCGIIEIGDITTEERSPIPHINLDDMLVEVASCI